LNVENCVDRYYQELKMEYDYLKQKFSLTSSQEKPTFFGIRPANFPTLRISQLANLYHGNTNLFQRFIETEHLDDLYNLFQIKASPYWDNHFTFGKSSKQSIKKLHKNFIDLLLINTLIPLKFCYAQHVGQDWNENLVALISKIKSESNSIIDGFNAIGALSENAMESQAKIQLYNKYCVQKKCMHCAVGVHLLNGNTYF